MRTGLLMAVLVLFGVSGPLYSVDREDPPPGKEKIHIVSDRLTVHSREDRAEFEGNVRADLNGLLVTADWVKILFHEGFTDEERLSRDQSVLKKITAGGRVTLAHENKTASSDQAVYSVKRQILVLSGEPAKVEMEENVITGGEITWYRADDRIEVTGRGETRVEALFHGKESRGSQRDDGQPGS